MSSMNIVVSAGLSLLVGMVFASSVQRLSFEEALDAADVVVLGRVVESPEYGVLSIHRNVVRHHRVAVERYFKGEGPEEITVTTVGGKYLAQTEDGQVERGAYARGQPQLPEESTELLLFLRIWDDGFMICSASHGVVRVKESPDGERTVKLRLKDPELMSQSTRENYAELTRGQSGEGWLQLSEAVCVKELPLLFEKALKR